jgi:formylglycine-generating enzyme required for sulfatase activity
VQITRPFYLGVHAVTQGQYQRVMGTNPSCFSPAGRGRDIVQHCDMSRFPVECVSWEDAAEFCHRLSALPAERSAGRTYRLPTEAEWEYACRAGMLSPFHFGDSLSSSQANFDGNYPYGDAPRSAYLARPAAVGSYAPNSFGLYDTHGNIWEWCADWYHSDYYAECPHRDPAGPQGGTARVIRGGCWLDFGRGCRAACRLNKAPAERSDLVGFRVAAVEAP